MAIESEKDLGCMSAATGKCCCGRSFGSGGLGSKRMLRWRMNRLSTVKSALVPPPPVPAIQGLHLVFYS